MKINYVPGIQHTIRWGPVMIYKCVDSACPLFLVSRYLSARKMFICYVRELLHAHSELDHVWSTPNIAYNKACFWKVFKSLIKHKVTKIVKIKFHINLILIEKSQNINIL